MNSEWMSDVQVTAKFRGQVFFFTLKQQLKAAPQKNFSCDQISCPWGPAEKRPFFVPLGLSARLGHYCVSTQDAMQMRKSLRRTSSKKIER